MAAKTPRRELTCPHCHKQFSAAVLGEGEQRGFKCPHCRLFVPENRAAEAKLRVDQPA